MPAPVEDSIVEPPQPPPFDYKIVTDERLARWDHSGGPDEQSGRQEVVQYGLDSRFEPDVPELTGLFQELFHAVVSSRLKGPEAGTIVKEVVSAAPMESDEASPALDPRVLFLDTISTELEFGHYHASLRDFVMATDISPLLMRQILDPPVLQELGLIRSTFARLGIRLSTNLLYRQANYNLLREETEGFAKLTTELFTTSSREPPHSDSALAMFEKVKGLIGTFDLDVGRVLDVTLDVFAAVLIKQYRFFIKFLRVSSWWPRSEVARSAAVYAGGLPVWALPDHYHWQTTEEEEAALAVKRHERDVAFWDRAREAHLDAFFELGGRQVATAEDLRIASDFADDAQLDAERRWIRETKTLPAPGNRVAAQLLGFKLRFYASEARDEDDVLPANLLYLAALLIKVGFISLADLWAHLWPADDHMEAVREKGLKEQEEKERARRPGGGMNALEKAGALPDDMPSAPTTSSRREAARKSDGQDKTDKEADKKAELPEPEEQKVRLLRQLLMIGAIPESLFILGRYTWLLEAYPDLFPMLHRILHHSVEKVFQDSRPKAEEPFDCGQKPLPDLDQTGVPKGSVKRSAPATKRILRWPFLDNPDHEGSHYRFYWDEWTDNVPVCQTVDDVFVLANTFLNISGVNVGRDADLVLKLCSIGQKSMAEDTSEHNLTRWKDLLRRLLVPALSLTESNTEVVSAVWNLVKQYPTTIRYSIYAEWYEGPTSRLPAMQAAFKRTRVETEGYLKRLSKTNITQMSRALAKPAVSSPGQVFKVALAQVEAYPNLIEVFVNTAKYYTDMGFDVLHWSLLRSLGGKERSRTQESSVLLTSQWLQRLAELSGRIFTEYSNMSPGPVLLYVNHQLYNGNSTDLVILQELISIMGGVVSQTNFNDAQLRAMTGGEVLRREVLKSSGDKREESEKSASRLMKVLVDTKVVAQLLINIAQYRQSALFNVPDDEAHVKVLSATTDDVHAILIQYLDLLRTNLKPEEFDDLVPDVIQLMRDFGLDPGLAFMIARPSLMARIMAPKPVSPKEDSTPSTTTPAIADAEGDVPMDTAGQEATEPASTDDKMLVDTETATAPAPATNGRKPDSFFDALQPLIEAAPDLIPKTDVWQRISPEFYAIFWSFQLGDLTLPQDSYTAEHQRLSGLASAVMKDRSDMSRSGMNRKDKLKRDYITRAEAIQAEMTQLMERYTKTKIRLTRGAAGDMWFPGGMAKINATSDTILEQCIVPRLQVSPIDAEYCFRMVKFLHESQAPNFKLMSLYDRFFNQNRLRSLIFSCTVREGEHLARFMKCVLGELSKWHGSKDAYEKEALGRREKAGVKSRIYHGFATAFGEDGKPTAWLEHDPFRDLLFKWHRNLMIALKSCLTGLEWMHIRNAITVLMAIIDYFPAVDFMGRQFLDILDTISKREAASKTAEESEEGHRVDLSVLAQSVYSAMQKRKTKWIILQAFRPGTVSSAPARPATPVTIDNESRLNALRSQLLLRKEKLMREKSGDQQKDDPKSATTKLRPNAPEFNPSSRSDAAGTGANPEDGEVKDRKDGKDGKDDKANSRTGSSSLPNRPSSLPTKPTRDSAKDSSAANLPKPPHDTKQSKRDSTPKPATPTPAAASLSRPEASRVASGHGLPNRPELPSRPPDVPFNRNGYNGPTIDRFGRPMPGSDRPPARDARDSRDSRDYRDTRDQHPRDSRDHRDARDHARGPDTSRQDRVAEHGRLTDRRTPDVNPRESVRPADRERGTRPEPPPRWNERGPASTAEREREQARDLRSSGPSGPSRDRDGRSPRDGTVSAPSNPRESTQGQDKARLAPDDRPDIINPGRAALLANDRPPSDRGPRDRSVGERSATQDRPVDIPVNPARAALIGEKVRDPPSAPRESQGRDRPPRTESPRRPPEGPRDEQHGRLRHPDHDVASRDVPSHPRGDNRPSGRDADRNNERSRDAPSHRGPPPRQPEPSDHGRLQQQDPNYGRLNPIQSVVDIPSGPSAGPPPSGPRGRGRNPQQRISSANGTPQSALPPPPPPPPARPDGRFDTPDRPPPTGPSSVSNRPRRGAPYDSNNAAMNPHTAPGAAAPPPTPVGVHPDRLRHINPAASGPSTPGNLPDRPSMSRPSPTMPVHPQPGMPPLSTPDRPAAANGATGSRHTPVNTSAMGGQSGPPTPTGPAAGSGHRQPRANRNPLDRVNSLIQQGGQGGGGQIPSGPGSNGRVPFSSQGRGRGGRTLLENSDAQILTSASPMGTPVQERPDPLCRGSHASDRPPRPEPIQTVGDSRDSRDNRHAPAGGDYDSSSRGELERSSSRREHRSDRSDRGDRSGRPSRRSSRERSPGRDRESKESRDYRHSRSDPAGPAGPSAGNNTREAERDSGSARRSGRDSATSHRDVPSGPSSSGRDLTMPGRESSHRGHRDSLVSGPRHDIPPPPPGRPGGHGRVDNMGGRGDDYGSRGGGSRQSAGGEGSFRDSRSSRPGDDRPGDDRGSARKRRSEEGRLGGERDKRPRHG